MHDVAIIGGGLAGLTLALQVKQQAPDLSVVVLERNSFPVPAGAHKVGEATVEIGAHYLAHTLGLEEYLEKQQLRKFGLRLFFGAGYHDDLSAADELGASSLLPAISYQLDRGKLENDLAALLEEQCHLKVELIKSSGGVFEVVIDGVLVYSKKKTGEFPDEMQLVKQLSAS